MNIAPTIGLRERYSRKEVARLIGKSVRAVVWLTESGKLVKRFEGREPYHQTDVNQYLVRYNAGKI
jgi:hypothetical protein